jgi:feruloyl-CoA synthase
MLDPADAILVPADDERSRLLSPPVVVDRRDLPDGGFVLRSRDALEPYPATMTSYLPHWAASDPSRPFIAQRGEGGGWCIAT